MEGTPLKLLEGKTAVVYGAAGGIGTAASKAFAREGAKVYLAGRTESTLRSLAEEITKAGGSAEASPVDAQDSVAVERHLQKVVADTGRLDVSFNLISVDVKMGSKLTDLSAEEFAEAAFAKTKSYFITGVAAAKIMQKQGSGVILGLTTGLGRIPVPETGIFPVENGAIETMYKQLAVESGPHGVRVVCLRTGGTPDNPVLQTVYEELARVRGITKEAVEKEGAQTTSLKRLPRMAEVANAAVLMASDYASAITATPVNATCGELVD